MPPLKTFGISQRDPRQFLVLTTSDGQPIAVTAKECGLTTPVIFVYADKDKAAAAIRDMPGMVGSEHVLEARIVPDLHAFVSHHEADGSIILLDYEVDLKDPDHPRAAGRLAAMPVTNARGGDA